MATFRTGETNHEPIVMEVPMSTIGAVTSCPRCGKELQQLAGAGEGGGRELVCTECKWSGVLHLPQSVR